MISGFNSPEHAVETLTLYNKVITLRILISMIFYPPVVKIDSGHNQALFVMAQRRNDARAKIMMMRRKGVDVDLSGYVSAADWVERLRQTHGLLTDPDR
ncbi:hypothetical protein B0T21DRAFT_367033 [Apiosordaria backusii]|uniref:Uncharacterized protein n=1 Tax=Apiosordaria backusii TaxID=314023 RepID=A0AA40BLR4_9PEZI|nr:hypothetical protein B0T21DRAFT_367033 [Apiosordaria backusii]